MTIAAANSNLLTKLISAVAQATSIIFSTGHYYFAEPFPNTSLNLHIKGTITNAAINNAALAHGTLLHFPNLQDGEIAIHLMGGSI